VRIVAREACIPSKCNARKKPSYTMIVCKKSKGKPLIISNEALVKPSRSCKWKCATRIEL
jgi:hypothetical protein